MSQAASASPDIRTSRSSGALGRLTSPYRNSRLTTAIMTFAIIGLAIAAYTTYIHYAGFAALLCVGGSGGHSTCETVQSSVWNNVAGIPVAVLGLVGYASIIASFQIRGELGRAAGFCVSLIGFGFSLYLTYREIFTIHAICEWCVGSAVCMTMLTLLTGYRFLQGDIA
jgi:uncharacterized membrane protein